MRLSIVVPCFDEQEVLNDTTKILTDLVEGLACEGIISDDSFILFVDFGNVLFRIDFLVNHIFPPAPA